jgi:hypothetical protein
MIEHTDDSQHEGHDERQLVFHWDLSSGEKGKYRDIQKATYSAEDLKKIYAAYDAEEVRGPIPAIGRRCM